MTGALLSTLRASSIPGVVDANSVASRRQGGIPTLPAPLEVGPVMRGRAGNRHPADDSVAWHSDLGRGLDLMKATFLTHEFPPHSHDAYVVEVIEAGADEF